MEHANQAQFTDRRRPFGIWLLAQVKRDDAVGALAKVAFGDPRFPREGDYKTASKYLNSVGAAIEMHEALEEAETDWLAL
jgi:uncharacterized protein YozE (UPF0346 family)